MDNQCALQEMFDRQLKLQQLFPKSVIISDDHLIKQKMILMFIDHIIEELIELRKELPIRKHWRTNKTKKPNWKKVMDEFSDVLHFVINLALVAGWTRDDVINAFIKKNDINFKRQEENY